MAKAKETVVFVHGLYMTGLEMSWLRLRVAHAGFETHQFHYHTLLEPVRANAERLASFIASLKADTLHLVAHSLGGLVILRMFESGATVPPGRVVLLGSPVNGSAAARRLVAMRFGWMLAQSGPDGLLEEYEPAWNGQRELGVIAGTGGLGLHPLSHALAKPNDGLVAEQETRLPGAVDYTNVRTTHLGLVFNSDVSEQVVAFLRWGKFRTP